MESHKQDSSKLHDALFSEYSVNESLTKHAQTHFFQYLTRESEKVLRQTDMKVLVKVSIFCSSKMVSLGFKNFSAFFDSELLNWKQHREIFMRFIDKSDFPGEDKQELHELVRSVDTSKEFFSKLNSIWKDLNIQGNNEIKKDVFYFTWLLFLYCRRVLAFRKNDLDDCAFLMVGVLTFILHRLPSHLSNSPVYIEKVRESFQVNEYESNFWTEKVSMVLTDYLNFLNYKKNNYFGILSRKFIKQNVSELSEFYGQMVNWDAFDERVLFEWEVERDVIDKDNRRPVNSKVLNYDDQISNFNEVISPNSRKSTPISSTMITIKWIQKIIRESFPDIREDNMELGELSGKVKQFQSIYENLLTSKGETSVITISYYQENLTLNLDISYFFLSLLKKIQKERNIDHEDLIYEKCLFLFCIEIVFFVKNYLQVTFIDLLDSYSCSGFDFFKNLSIFSNISRIPEGLKFHLEQIKIKILMHLGWKTNGSIHLTIQDYLSNSNSKPLEDNFNKYKGIFPEDYEKFFDQMMIQVGIHIDSLCKSLKIEQSLCEKIWKTVKYILSEKTEILFGKHICLIILCSIFAVKKLENPIKFNDIIHEYRKTFGEEREVFGEIKLNALETVGIVDYYNKVFVNEVKDFIDNRIQPLVPRVASLNPNNSLVELVNSAGQQKLSPITTPRTQCLMASPNAAVKNYLPIRPLTFEVKGSLNPPKFMRMVLGQEFDDSIPEPVIKKNNE